MYVILYHLYVILVYLYVILYHLDVITYHAYMSGEGYVAFYATPNPFHFNKICLNQLYVIRM